MTSQNRSTLTAELHTDAFRVILRNLYLPLENNLEIPISKKKSFKETKRSTAPIGEKLLVVVKLSFMSRYLKAYD